MCLTHPYVLPSFFSFPTKQMNSFYMEYKEKLWFSGSARIPERALVYCFRLQAERERTARASIGS